MFTFTDLECYDLLILSVQNFIKIVNQCRISIYLSIYLFHVISLVFSLSNLFCSFLFATCFTPNSTFKQKSMHFKSLRDGRLALLFTFDVPTVIVDTNRLWLERKRSGRNQRELIQRETVTLKIGAIKLYMCTKPNVYKLCGRRVWVGNVCINKAQQYQWQLAIEQWMMRNSADGLDKTELN